MPLPSVDTSMFQNQPYNGATVAQAVMGAFRSAQQMALQQEQQKRDNALEDEKMQWKREDRQRQQSVFDPIEEEKAKLGLVQDQLQVTKQKFQLQSARRENEAAVSQMSAAMENDALGDDLIAKIGEYHINPDKSGTAEADDDLLGTLGQLENLATSGAFTPAMEGRVAGTLAKAKFSPTIQKAKENQFIRTGLVGIRDTIDSYPPELRSQAYTAVSVLQNGQVTQSSVSAAIDALDRFEKSMGKTTSSVKQQASISDLRQMASDENIDPVLRNQAAAQLKQMLPAADGMPKAAPGSAPVAGNPLLPDVTPSNVREMSTEALLKLTGKK